MFHFDSVKLEGIVMLRMLEDVLVIVTLALGVCILVLANWWGKFDSMKNEFYGESLQKYKKKRNICLTLIEVVMTLFICGFISCVVFAVLLLK